MVKAFLLGLVVLLSSCAAGPKVVTQADAANEAWAFVCQHSGYSCRGLEAPHIVTTDLDVFGAYGLYFGSSIIYFHDGLDVNTPFGVSVMVHEMTHYLQAKRGGVVIGRSRGEMCLAEVEAYQVSNLYMKAHNGPEADVFRGC